MRTPSEFDDIRPYNDDEVRPTIDRLLDDSEFLDAIARLKMPKAGSLRLRLMRPLVKRALIKEIGDVNTVDAFQLQVVEKYLRQTVNKTTTDLTVSGLEHLVANKAYCFISNHRDIAMDPGFVNWVLYSNGFQTLRIAIGDNLLTKPFASDIMRLNKSFIVNRSATAPREKLKAAKNLSSYIQYSVAEENANIWIAQRVGRAKDGIDSTNPAIIRMLSMSKSKQETFGEYIARANIVPVSISYEWDPCDVSKACELTTIEREGSYEKGEQEDVQSIAMGISGFKGHMHVAFGEPLSPSLESVDEAVAVLDQQILDNYVLHPSNCVAYQMLEGEVPSVPVTAKGVDFKEYDAQQEREILESRISDLDDATRHTFLKIYANPVYSKLADVSPKAES